MRERELGPDPLEMDAASFRERLRGTRGGIKATLMNQKMLAGIGNLYSDEILFQARIHPRTSVAQLDDPTLENLHKETLRVLKTAIEREAYPQELPDSFLLSHRQEGARCPRGNGGDPEAPSRRKNRLLLPHLPTETTPTNKILA